MVPPRFPIDTANCRAGVASCGALMLAGCVQSALQQWALTFEYRPTSEPTATVVDWMCVTAARRR